MHLKTPLQINVVAFAADHTIPIGSVQLPPDQPRVILVPQEEMLKEYEGWGNDVIGLLSCIPKPSKWFIHVVHPPLESYVKGRIALVGDAVRPVQLPARYNVTNVNQGARHASALGCRRWSGHRRCVCNRWLA